MRWVPLRDLQEVVKFFTIVILTSLRNLSACKSSFFLEWCLWGNNRIIGAVYFYTTLVEIFPIFPFLSLCHVYLAICQLYTMRCWRFASKGKCWTEIVIFALITGIWNTWIPFFVISRKLRAIFVCDFL